jgi:hypothetical protein
MITDYEPNIHKASSYCHHCYALLTQETPEPIAPPESKPQNVIVPLPPIDENELRLLQLLEDSRREYQALEDAVERKFQTAMRIWREQQAEYQCQIDNLRSQEDREYRENQYSPEYRRLQKARQKLEEEKQFNYAPKRINYYPKEKTEE